MTFLQSMLFLQPMLLAALPLVLLPIAIHLINRRRHRSLEWAAMMFLVDARKMARGMARLRYWLIMAVRMLAVGVLIVAAARPLGSGWFGLAIGGRPDTTIILLDRSASMSQQARQAAQSKRSTGLAKLSAWLEMTGGGTRVVLIDSADCGPRDITPGGPLSDFPGTGPTATSADIPAMLQTALDDMIANKAGRTDVWICSDLRAGDWKPDDGRWVALRTALQRRPGTRFHLLTYPNTGTDNVAVRVVRVKKRRIGSRTELVLNVTLQCKPEPRKTRTLPLTLIVNGARSVVNVEMTDGRYDLTGHTIVLDGQTTEGWGRVEIPGDANPRDNVAYFVFADPPKNKTVIVSDDPDSTDAVRLAVTSPSEPGELYTATVVPADRTDQIDWSSASLVVWGVPLPTGTVARQLRHAVARGCSVLFLPPEQAGEHALFGCRWGEWNHVAADTPTPIVSWRDDSELLRHDRSGQPLPVGSLEVVRYRAIEGPGTPVAQLDGNRPFLLRAPTEGGHVYFCATLPEAAHSNLATEGVVLYVLLQRALSAGSETLGKARQLVAGTPAAREAIDAKPLGEIPPDLVSAERPYAAGAYRTDKHLLAIGRPPTEDALQTIDQATLDSLFRGLDYRLVTDRAGSSKPLASETWRAFLVVMALALIGEASLCLRE